MSYSESQVQEMIKGIAKIQAEARGSMESRMDGLTKDLDDSRKQLEAMEKIVARSQFPGGGSAKGDGTDVIGAHAAAAPVEGKLFFQDAVGRTHEALPVKSRISALTAEAATAEGVGPGSLGKILRAKILGDTMGLNLGEVKALGESVGGAGGWFVSPALSSYVVDLARNKSCVLLAGGWTLPMSTEEMTLVKVLTDPTAYWVKEHAKITETEGTFGPIKLKAMVVGCLVRVSRALLEDAPNSGNVIESQISAALGLEIDRCALLGNGVNEPKGLQNCADINSYSMGANGLALANYDPFSYAVQYVAEDNGLATSVIMAPRTAGNLDRLKEGTTNAPLMPPPSFQALQKFSTNQIPITQTQGSSTVASSAFVGDFKNIVLGMRRQLTIDVAASGVGSGSVDVFSSVEALIRGYLTPPASSLNRHWRRPPGRPRA